MRNFKKKIYQIIFETDTKAGRSFDIVLLWIIVISVVSTILESVKEMSVRYNFLFTLFEWCFTIFFSIEYMIRIWVSRRSKKYIFSFLGIVDFLALLPTYLTLFFAGSNYLVVIRTIRLLRVFRILKLGRYVSEAAILADAMKSSRHKILVFLGALSAMVMIMGTLMYLIEGKESGFTSIPKSIYWAIVTVTTVGYGDITPTTVLGQAFASALMLMGYAIIAVPTGIVTSEITSVQKNEQTHQKKSISEDDPNKKEQAASYCSHCGAKL